MPLPSTRSTLLWKNVAAPGKPRLIVDELGYVPFSQTGAELFFEIFSQRHERGSTIVASYLPFEEWTSVFGSQRLTGALLDRLTHHVHILELNGERYRFKRRRGGGVRPKQPMRKPQPPIPKLAKSSPLPAPAANSGHLRRGGPGAKQQNENYNDKKCVGIHVRLLSLPPRQVIQRRGSR